MAVEFFSAVDKVDGPTGKGQIASTLPAWYFEKNIRDLEDDIRQTKRRLDSGQIAHNKEAQVKVELRRKEKKLASLKDAKPVVDDKTRDVFAKVHDEMSESLSAAMYTREEEKRGTVNPARLADLMSKPSIKVSGKVAEMAASNGFPVSKDGKMSMTDLSIIWKSTGRILEKETNTEVLRRDR